MTILAILLAKLISWLSRAFNLGAGETWPGEIALKFDPEILSKIIPQNIILVAGTNGKTTTSLLLKNILEKNGNEVIHNASGANLLNGIISALITSPKVDWAVLECDENTLPQVLRMLKPVQHDDYKIIVLLLNLFRDQLDRYGEVDLIADRWLGSLGVLVGLGKETMVIINADDPQLAWIGKNLNSGVKYFGLDDKKLFLSEMQHATDSIYCPKCGTRLTYEGIYFSHLGKWGCGKCGLGRPKTDLSNLSNLSNLRGVYNRYNILAAVLAAKEVGVREEIIKKGIEEFKPAFGRQEEIEVKEKKVKIILSKNPAGFNESLRTLKDFPGEKNLLLILNDRIPDGRDVSWIWDVDFEAIGKIGGIRNIGVSGDRAYDLGLRLKYAEIGELRVFGNLGDAIKTGLEKTQKGETLYILATYSAMLEARKILTGRKIL